MLCFCLWECICKLRCLWRPEVYDSLELWLKAVVSHWMWVLRVELGSSARAVGALDLWAISLVLKFHFHEWHIILHVQVSSEMMGHMASFFFNSLRNYQTFARLPVVAFHTPNNPFGLWNFLNVIVHTTYQGFCFCPYQLLYCLLFLLFQLQHYANTLEWLSFLLKSL